MTQSNTGMSKPPEGVIAGESVPVGSEPDEYDEMLIQKVEAMLKGRGEAYAGMGDSELREKAIETLRKNGVSM
jgi:hypothetical protein